MSADVLFTLGLSTQFAVRSKNAVHLEVLGATVGDPPVVTFAELAVGMDRIPKGMWRGSLGTLGPPDRRWWKSAAGLKPGEKSLAYPYYGGGLLLREGSFHKAEAEGATELAMAAYFHLGTWWVGEPLLEGTPIALGAEVRCVLATPFGFDSRNPTYSSLQILVRVAWPLGY